MKQRNILVVLLLLVLAAVAAWYFMRPVKHCKVKFRESPATRKLDVVCETNTCDKSCILETRRKNTEDDWADPDNSHVFDSAAYEYRCMCR